MLKKLIFASAMLNLAYLAHASEGTVFINNQPSYSVITISGAAAREIFELNKKLGFPSQQVCGMEVTTGKVFTCFAKAENYSCGAYLKNDTSMTPAMVGCRGISHP